MAQISAIISGCCDAFIEYVDNNCLCTRCGTIINNITKDDELTISIDYNISSDKNENLNISNDLLMDRLNKFKRNANDITCALLINDECKCKKCGGECRMSRNQALQKICVCTKCRHTFVY